MNDSVIAGALFDFMGWLTSRPKRIMLSSVDDASPAVDAIRDFAKMRGLSLDDAKVQDWQDNTTLPAAERNKLAAWMMAQGYATGHGDTMEQLLEEFKREASFDKAELWIKRINDAVAPLQERIQDLYKQLDEAERELDSQYKLGMEAEREACAKVCEDYTDKSDADHESHGYSCAAAIRARGNT